jgi:GxxExxY protein
MNELLYKQETYEIIGKCMEVHKILGAGFSEIVYKDALEMEFKLANIFYEREKKYDVEYKGKILPHKFFADFVVNDKIILEVKGVKAFDDLHVAQCILRK